MISEQEYTPLEHEGRARMIAGSISLGKSDAQAEAEVGRWLATHDAQVKAEALEGAADVYEALPEGERTYFPAIHSGWLRKRAASVRQEGSK